MEQEDSIPERLTHQSGMLIAGVGQKTRRLLEQQSEELPFRVPEQERARQQQQQQRWVSGVLFGPQHSSIALGPVRTDRWESVGCTPEESRAYSGDTRCGIQKSTRASYFGRATEDLAGPPRV
jgi:hypothetical protein